MAVTAQTPFSQFTAAPGATVFSSEFRVLQASDLVVKVNGAVIASGFSVSGIGAAGGVDVTFSTPMTGGEVVELLREVPLTRATDYQQLGDFLSPVVNLDFDRLWMSQQDQEFKIGSSLRLPFPEQVQELPAVADRIRKLFYFDKTGAPVFVGGTPGTVWGTNSTGDLVSVVPASGSAADLALNLASPGIGKGDDILATAAHTFTKVSEALAAIDWAAQSAPDGINVLRYVPPAQWAGLMAGTLVYDVAPALQAAIDACAERIAGVDQVPVSKSVYLPFRKALIGTTIDLTSDNGTSNRRGIRIRGAVAGSGDFVYGTNLVGQTNGKAIFEIIDNDNVQLENLTLTNAATNGATIGVYQARRTGGASPSQWTGNCLFRNVTVTFTNDGITQNNNFGTIGFLNVAGEETTYERCEVWANCPLILSWSNTVKKAVNSLAATTYDTFEYSPVHAAQADITEGFSNTVFRTQNCRFIAKGWNAPVVLLHEVGSYHSDGDFLQKRDSTTGPNGTNSIGYEFWNAYHVSMESTCENLKTPMLFHRSIGGLTANIRGSTGAIGQAVGLLHFGMDAAGFDFGNVNVSLDYPSEIPHGLATYTTPAGIGVDEPAATTWRNVDLKINRAAQFATVDPKLIYSAINSTVATRDRSYRADHRQLRIPLASKSIGAPAAATDLLNIALPTAIANLSGFSCTVKAYLHVSNAESEGAGMPSSASVTAMWQITRDQSPSTVVVTSQTLEKLTASINSGGNNITDLTLSHATTGTASVVLRIASVQAGANAAEAWVSGYVEIIYAGGYSRAPVVTVL